MKLVDNTRVEVYMEPRYTRSLLFAPCFRTGLRTLAFKKKMNSTAIEAEVTRLGVKLQSPTPVEGLVLESIKEIVVVRRGAKAEVQIYDAVEIGRRFYSCLVFTTDSATCLQQCISGDESVAAQFLTRAVRVFFLLIF